ncbi:serine hydrolase domain-containing protein [Pseudoroseicyclus sp. H15]
MRTSVLPLCLAALAIPAALSAEPDLRASLDQLAPELLAREDVPALAVGYIADGEVQWTAIYGEQAPGQPATEETLFNVASLTKPIVSELALSLASEGEIDLTAPMAPAWTDGDLADDPRAALITPEMALSHRTGFLRNWREDMPGGQLTIEAEPGTVSAYSGENFSALGKFIVGSVSPDFPGLVQAHVFGPAGMTDTFFSPDPSWEGRVAMVRGPDGELALPSFSEGGSAADDLHSTIGDYSRFTAWAMAGEHLTEELREARGSITIDDTAAACPEGIIPQDMCPAASGYGLGWMVYDSGDHNFLLHNGKGWGERTIALFAPEEDFGVVVFTSGANGRTVISEVLQLLVPDDRLNTLVAAEAAYEMR